MVDRFRTILRLNNLVTLLTENGGGDFPQFLKDQTFDHRLKCKRFDSPATRLYRPSLVMLIDDEFVAMSDGVVHVPMPMGFRTFPSFVFVLVMFTVHVGMLMVDDVMLMF